MIKNKNIKIRNVHRVPNFMKKPKKNYEKNNQKNKKKRKKNQNLENEMDIYQRISPLEKFCYPKQLEIKQKTVLDWTRKYQQQTRSVFKMDPQLIRLSWLKEGFDLRGIVNEIVFKCEDPKVGAELTAALKIQKQKLITGSVKLNDEGNLHSILSLK